MGINDPVVEMALDAAKRLFALAKTVLVITGAGISAESGVPTFRGAGGYWRNKHFSDLATPEAFAANPQEVWEWYCSRRQTVTACQPNAAHIALTEWAKRRSGITLVTQNVDGLHERAGHPDVVRLHGTLWMNRCTACGTEREDRSLSYDALPQSPCCRAPERPAIVWFGECIPEEPLNRAHRATLDSEAVLVIGTSGVVYPAAGFVERCAERGIPVIDVNPDLTSLPSTIAITANAADAIPLILS